MIVISSTRVENCVLIHGITETQGENTDNISPCTINEHLEVALAENELHRTHRTGNPKSGKKRLRPIIVKFVTLQNQKKYFRK